MKNPHLSILLFLLLFLSARAQVDLVPERFSLEPELSYSANIPAPEAFLGYRLGEQFSFYADVVRYCEALAAASPRVDLRRYGRTYEGRDLLLLVITSEANHRDLEEIRLRRVRMAAGELNSADANQAINNDPIFTSLSYNIHGNEPSGTEAAMQTAYRLAAVEGEEAKRLLEQSVVLMFMCVNPDGRDRYTYWYRSVQRQMPAAEPRDLEHYEPWPGGRSNHYWFDLNRDWVWGIHPEMRGLAVEYQRWMPQVHVDYHEQSYNANYFTMPGTTPRNLLLPDAYEAWTDTFGRANIREFDRFQINYFTRDAFDFFYPGYGSSYPSVMGAIGMLTEQGGISAGRAVETDDGYVLTFRQRVFDQYLTSIATIKKAAERRRELLRYSFETWQPSNSKSIVKAYYLVDNGNGYLRDVVAMLLRQGVKVEKASAEFTLISARDYRNGQVSRKTLPAGTIVISANQPRHLFLHSVLERNMAIEDSVMYDMSVWAAPLAYNLEAYSSDRPTLVPSEPVREAPSSPAGLFNPEAQYAFVIEWRQRDAPRALAMLWEKGYRVRAAAAPFNTGARAYGAGSLIVLRGRNLEKAATIVSDMEEIAREAGVRIDGQSTGRVREGYDLANTRNRPLKAPRVALLVDEPFSSLTAGQIYFLFDQETRLPIQRIRASLLRQTALPNFGSRYGVADLADFDVLILPGGGEGLNSLFGEKEIEQLKAWINQGGVLVAAESAAPFFTDSGGKLTKVKMLEAIKDSSDAAKFLAYADRQDYAGKKRVPGAALRASIDVTHPLAFGLDAELYTLKYGTEAIRPDPEIQTIGRYHPAAEELLAAGYASEENLRRLAGNTFAAVVPMGQGKVVLLLDNIQFRMFWRGPSRMMQNAAMILPGF